MSGTGEATTVPDQLTFSVDVPKTAFNVSTRVQPSQPHDPCGPRGEGSAVITGYAVSQRLSVLVRTLPDSGDAISAAAAAGGNAIRLHGVSWRVGDEPGLLRKARDAAMADARAKAEQ